MKHKQYCKTTKCVIQDAVLHCSSVSLLMLVYCLSTCLRRCTSNPMKYVLYLNPSISKCLGKSEQALTEVCVLFCTDWTQQVYLSITAQMSAWQIGTHCHLLLRNLRKVKDKTSWVWLFEIYNMTLCSNHLQKFCNHGLFNISV